MWAFVICLAVLLLASLYLWKFQTALFSKAVLGVSSAIAIVGELAQQLGLFDWSSVLPPPFAGLMTLAVLVVSFLARFTRSDPAAD